MPYYVVTLRQNNKTSKVKILQASGSDAEKEAIQLHPGHEVINVSREGDNVLAPSTRRRGSSSE